MQKRLHEEKKKMSFQFRPHRRTLIEAMKEVKTFNSLAELIENQKPELAQWGVEITAENVKVTPYCYDKRINWNTYIVTLEDYGVLGFTDGPVE
jgi:hypothetical protein